MLAAPGCYGRAEQDSRGKAKVDNSQGMGAAMKNSFQASLVETLAEEQAEQGASEEAVPEASEAPGNSFLDAEARAAARGLGQQAAADFQESLAVKAHDAVMEDKANG